MTNVVTDLAAALVVGLLTLGPMVGAMLLLNRRDRRRQALLHAAWSLTPRDLRSVIAIQVHVSPVSWRGRVEADMRGCRRAEIWEAFSGWRAGLPPGVRLLVRGAEDAGRPSGFEKTYCLWATIADAASRSSSARLRWTPQR